MFQISKRLDGFRRKGGAVVGTCCLVAVGGASASLADAAKDFAALERRMLEAESVRVAARVVAEGAIEVDVAGGAEIGPAGRVVLRFDGTFAGQPAALQLVGDGEMLFGGNGDKSFANEQPEATLEALVIGVTRMGILHNLARLTGGAAPDHAEGGVAEWVVVEEFAEEPETEIAGRPARGLRFALRVAGEPSGDATLWLDRESGLPVQRDQVVRFPQGEMHVRETYDVFEIDDPKAPTRGNSDGSGSVPIREGGG